MKTVCSGTVAACKVVFCELLGGIWDAIRSWPCSCMLLERGLNILFLHQVITMATWAASIASILHLVETKTVDIFIYHAEPLCVLMGPYRIWSICIAGFHFCNKNFLLWALPIVSLSHTCVICCFDIVTFSVHIFMVRTNSQNSLKALCGYEEKNWLFSTW